MRKILCQPCGSVIKPTTLEDISHGFTVRRKSGKTKGHYCCDDCGELIPVCAPVVCLSSPENMEEWESDYIS